MDKKITSVESYKDMIIQQMKDLETYSENFNVLIESLATQCYWRDVNLSEWKAFQKDSGYFMVYPYTNKSGSTNLTAVPYLNNNRNFNDSILKLCKELGLSPVSYSKASVPSDETDELDEFLKEND